MNKPELQKTQEKNYILREYIKYFGTLPDINLLELVVNFPVQKYYFLNHPQRDIIGPMLTYKMKFYEV